MTNTPRHESEAPQAALTTLCKRHLEREETLLSSTLALVRHMEDAFGHPPQAFAPALSRHEQVAQQVAELHRERRLFREAAARLLNRPADAVAVPDVIRAAPDGDRAGLQGDLERVRKLAEALTAANQRVAIHLRVFLAAYRRILRDLTNTALGSGRYGRAGQAESFEYRPLLQIHG